MREHLRRILPMNHHISKTRPRMSGAERAAQFAPFAALSGFAECIDTARTTKTLKRDLDEDASAALNAALGQLALLPRDRRKVEMTRAVRSEKYGTTYTIQRAEVRSIDTAGRAIILVQGETVPLDDICAIRILEDDGYNSSNTE